MSACLSASTAAGLPASGVTPTVHAPPSASRSPTAGASRTWWDTAPMREAAAMNASA